MNRALVTAGVAAGMIASVALPASSAQAAPAGNGATVVIQQNGVTTHTICAFDDVWLAASGFAPNRGRVVARIEAIGGGGIVAGGSIPLSGGSGTVDTGTPGPYFIGTKVRVRFQVGSSDHPVNLGSFSATIVDC